jgi:hypothetical protein
VKQANDRALNGKTNAQSLISQTSQDINDKVSSQPYDSKVKTSVPVKKAPGSPVVDKVADHVLPYHTEVE